MALIRQLLIVFFLILGGTGSRAQSCDDFHLHTCPIPDFSYYYDQQSASFAMNLSDTTELRIIVFEKSDYYVSVCAHRRIKRINFSIYEDTPERRLLYSNESHNFSDSVKFSNEVTRQLVLEVSLPREGNEQAGSKARCVGVMIAKRIRVDALKQD